jgi:alpha-1,3-rhamnosyl/mannosyltransferase
MALTVGIDARAAQEERGGRGTLVRELLRAVAASDTPHRFRLLAREPWDDAPRDPRFTWALTALPDPAWNLAAAVRASASCDVLLSTNSYLTAWATTIPTVVVVCDMVAFHPELLPQRRAALIERATLPLAVRRARTLAAISQATADDLIALQPAAASKTVVTELAADARFATGGAPDAEVLARHGLTGRSYVLGVGTLEPRKNLPRLIEAFAALPDALRAEHELVLVGALGWDTDETLQAVERHRGLVRTLGHVPADDLPALYRGAAIFAYPSLYEGFGLPVLEAMTAGAPVLTSGVSSLPEVGGDAAVYVDPRDVRSIRDGLAGLLEDPPRRAELSAAAVARATRFSWARYAAQTLAACELVA